MERTMFYFVSSDLFFFATYCIGKYKVLESYLAQISWLGTESWQKSPDLK